VPKELITQFQLDDLKLQQKPSFVPLTKDQEVVKVFDSETGIAQRRLSNGISVNYKVLSPLQICGYFLVYKSYSHFCANSASVQLYAMFYPKIWFII
jgi:hypothetical protein